MTRKKSGAKQFGGTDFVNPTKLGKQSIQDKLVEMTDGGCDYTFRLHWECASHEGCAGGMS